MSDGIKGNEAKTMKEEEGNVGTTTDAVFGEITEDGPNYRSMGWISTIVLMCKTMIGLGVLSMPSTFDILGLIPGIISLLAVASISIWCMYVVGSVKLKHPQVYAIDDVGQLLFGKFGRESFGAMFCIFWIFASGSGMLTISIGLNAVSTHGACTAIFMAVAAVATFIGCSVRTLHKMSWVAWGGLVSVLVAIVTVTIAVGVQDRPSEAPQEGTWVSDYELFKQPTFLQAVGAISIMVFTFAGSTAFFAIVSEMREPEMFTRSLIISQTIVTGTYMTIGIVVYYYCGSYVASPALGSAGTLMKKICYGIGLPGILVSTVILAHIPAKYIFVRLLRGTPHLSSNSPTHWITWLGSTGGVTIIAYIIASSVPSFNDLVSLIGALLGTVISYQPMGAIWLYDNWSKEKRQRNLKWYLQVCWAIIVMVGGTFLMISGTYAAMVNIVNAYSKANTSPAWSCADNSNSV